MFGILFALLRPLFRRALRRTLAGRRRDPENSYLGRFTRREADYINRLTWDTFKKLERNLPAEQNLGGELNVRLAALTLACFRAMTEFGVKKDYAIDLTADAGWLVYERWGQLALALTILKNGNPQKKMNARILLFLRFPFDGPSYRYEVLEENKTFAINFTDARPRSTSGQWAPPTFAIGPGARLIIHWPNFGAAVLKGPATWLSEIRSAICDGPRKSGRRKGVRESGML